jgi:hypothetical protein
VQGLRDGDPAGALQERAVHRREQARGEQPVRDPPAEACRLRVLVVDMDFVLVAADRGKEQQIGIGDRLGERRLVADLELFEALPAAQ